MNPRGAGLVLGVMLFLSAMPSHAETGVKNTALIRECSDVAKSLPRSRTHYLRRELFNYEFSFLSETPGANRLRLEENLRQTCDVVAGRVPDPSLSARGPAIAQGRPVALAPVEARSTRVSYPVSPAPATPPPAIARGEPHYNPWARPAFDTPAELVQATPSAPRRSGGRRSMIRLQ